MNNINIIALIILLPVSIFILNAWIWLFDNIFGLEKQKNKIIILTIIMGLLSGIGIVLYPKIIGFFGLNQLDFTNSDNLTNNNFMIIGLFLLYLSTLVLISKIFISGLKFSKFFIINSLIFIIIFSVANYLGLTYISDSIAIYYLFVAYGEEFAKYLIGVNFFEKWKYSNNDILLFSILSAMGFAFTENIIYMISGIGTQNFLVQIMGGLGIIVSRGLIGFIIHIIFTGNVGLFSMKGIQKNNVFKLVTLGIIIGTLSHFAYNLLLAKNFKIIILFFLIIGYFWISFLFYKSDRLYVENGLLYDI